ncbi:aromatic-ring-hydroxylating dioxygenase subunit beta [Sphingobium algorifonticola]|nr:aromatic-ring-hydroxylating dioxygenase subunit beta [Sphingobium algorifonticola]
MSDPLSQEVDAFVHHEARLLDECRYAEWVDLFLPDARYWVPVSIEQRDPMDGPSHFHDDIQVLKARTHRLANPRAFGAEPSPRTAHIVSGVRVDRTMDDGALVVSSTQIMLEYRNRGGFEADQRMFGGRVTHLLRRMPEGLRIARKRVDLINAEGPFNAMAAPI